MSVPFHDEPTFYAWLRSLSRRQQDAAVELRGPKGRGKSSLALWMQLRTDPAITPKDAMESLVYSHEHFVTAYRRLAAKRESGDDGTAFLWVDDATRIFNRRAHMTKKNRAVLDLNRTMRDAMRSIMLLLTQDDLLERPLMDGGNYVQIIFHKPYAATVYWPVHRRRFQGEPYMRAVFRLRWPKPETVYPKTWAAYQARRRSMTKELTAELLGDLRGDKKKERSYKSKRELILEARRRNPKASSFEIAKETGVTSGYVRAVVAESP